MPSRPPSARSAPSARRSSSSGAARSTPSRRPRVSVIMPARNEERWIKDALDALSKQTYNDFEVIVVDDCSTDRTGAIVTACKDPRVRLLRTERPSRSSGARNLAIARARGEFLFFTDADCVPRADWIAQGLAAFTSPAILGVEGYLRYVSDTYVPVRSDRVVSNEQPGWGMTANMAYRASAVNAVGNFDATLSRLEDRDLFLKIKARGSIAWNPKMLVYHQHTTLTWRQFLVYGAREVRDDLLFSKRWGERRGMCGPFYQPLALLAIVFPPLILGTFFLHRYRTSHDFLLFLLIYPGLIYQRIEVWRWAIKHKVLAI